MPHTVSLLRLQEQWVSFYSQTLFPQLPVQAVVIARLKKAHFSSFAFNPSSPSQGLDCTNWLSPLWKTNRPRKVHPRLSCTVLYCIPQCKEVGKHPLGFCPLTDGSPHTGAGYHLCSAALSLLTCVS